MPWAPGRIPAPALIPDRTVDLIPAPGLIVDLIPAPIPGRDLIAALIRDLILVLIAVLVVEASRILRRNPVPKSVRTLAPGADARMHTIRGLSFC